MTNVFVWRVAGLQAELFYVREGVVNTYAMNFVVPVPAHISELEFSWQSLTKHPVSTYTKHGSEVKLRVMSFCTDVRGKIITLCACQVRLHDKRHLPHNYYCNYGFTMLYTYFNMT